MRRVLFLYARKLSLLHKCDDSHQHTLAHRRCALLSFIFSILMSVTAYASGTYAVVMGERVNVRSCAEINEINRLFQVDRGTVVEIHGISGDFFSATIQGTSYVYISRDFVRFRETEGTVTAPFAWIYDLPSDKGGTAITMVLEGDTITVTSAFENWYGVLLDNSTVFVEQSGVEIPYFVELPAARIGTTLADIIVDTSMNYLGTRYVWGGTSPNGFDCSGFIVYLFSPHGITLNRRSRDMARNGIAVARNELERGDLVFFGWGGEISHVGLYIGYGEFIHSSTNRTGGVIISHMNDHRNQAFITARRVL